MGTFYRQGGLIFGLGELQCLQALTRPELLLVGVLQTDAVPVGQEGCLLNDRRPRRSVVLEDAVDASLCLLERHAPAGHTVTAYDAHEVAAEDLGAAGLGDVVPGDLADEHVAGVCERAWVEMPATPLDGHARESVPE